jgi:hypothetical protein
MVGKMAARADVIGANLRHLFKLTSKGGRMTAKTLKLKVRFHFQEFTKHLKKTLIFKEFLMCLIIFFVKETILKLTLRLIIRLPVGLILKLILRVILFIRSLIYNLLSDYHKRNRMIDDLIDELIDLRSILTFIIRLIQ